MKKRDHTQKDRSQREGGREGGRVKENGPQWQPPRSCAMNSSYQHVPHWVLGLVAFIIISFHDVDASLSCHWTGSAGLVPRPSSSTGPHQAQTMGGSTRTTSHEQRGRGSPRSLFPLLVWLWGRAECARARRQWQPFAGTSEGGRRPSRLNDRTKGRTNIVFARLADGRIYVYLEFGLGARDPHLEYGFHKFAKIWMWKS